MGWVLAMAEHLRCHCVSWVFTQSVLTAAPCFADRRRRGVTGLRCKGHHCRGSAPRAPEVGFVCLMDYIQKVTGSTPALVEPLSKLGELYTRKLWHQLTDQLIEFLREPTNISLINHMEFYENFISKFEVKMNQLRFAVAVTILAKHLKSHEEAAAFYVRLLDKRGRLGPEAALFLDMELALLKLKQGELRDLDGLLKESKATLDGLAGAETIVHSSYYKTASEYHKVMGPPEAFYKNALMFLAYTPVESLAPDEKYTLATDISLAALTGDGVFNFGEVLATPILQVLHQTPNAWLSAVLHAFDAGDVDAFALLVEQNRQAYFSQPALVSRQDFVKEKVVLLSLMNLVFERPAHERTIQFRDIADRGRLPVEQVEWLVMRAMSLGLIKGVIDEVEQTVSVTWVQPRVLNTDQIRQLASRLGSWGDKVKETLHYVEDQTPELFN